MVGFLCLKSQFFSCFSHTTGQDTAEPIAVGQMVIGMLLLHMAKPRAVGQMVIGMLPLPVGKPRAVGQMVIGMFPLPPPTAGPRSVEEIVVGAILPYMTELSTAERVVTGINLPPSHMLRHIVV